MQVAKLEVYTMLMLPGRSKPHSMTKERPLLVKVVLLEEGQETVEPVVPVAEVAAGARSMMALAIGASTGLATGAAMVVERRRESARALR